MFLRAEWGGLLQGHPGRPLQAEVSLAAVEALEAEAPPGVGSASSVNELGKGKGQRGGDASDCCKESALPASGRSLIRRSGPSFWYGSLAFSQSIPKLGCNVSGDQGAILVAFHSQLPLPFLLPTCSSVFVQ